MKVTIPARPKAAKRRLCVYVTKESTAKLKKLSKASGVSMSEIIDRAIQDCLQ